MDSVGKMFMNLTKFKPSVWKRLRE